MMGIQRQSNDHPAARDLHTLPSTEGDHIPAMNPMSNLATPPLVMNPMIVHIPDETTTSGKVPSGD